LLAATLTNIDYPALPYRKPLQSVLLTATEILLAVPVRILLAVEPSGFAGNYGIA